MLARLFLYNISLNVVNVRTNWMEETYYNSTVSLNLVISNKLRARRGGIGG